MFREDKIIMEATEVDEEKKYYGLTDCMTHIQHTDPAIPN